MYLKSMYHLKHYFPVIYKTTKKENNQANLGKKFRTFWSNAAYVKCNMVYLQLGACNVWLLMFVFGIKQVKY